MRDGGIELGGIVQLEPALFFALQNTAPFPTSVFSSLYHASCIDAIIFAGRKKHVNFRTRCSFMQRCGSYFEMYFFRKIAAGHTGSLEKTAGLWYNASCVVMRVRMHAIRCTAKSIQGITAQFGGGKNCVFCVVCLPKYSFTASKPSVFGHRIRRKMHRLPHRFIRCGAAFISRCPLGTKTSRR